ncbi:MAG: hypothetical protein RLN60_03510 [Phycisphaerales bacterium]
MANATNSGTANQPADRLRFGAIQAAIWRNVSDEGRVLYSVTFDRCYVDQEGDWQSSSAFGRNDLLVLAKLADRCNTRIYELQADDNARDSENAEEQPAQAASAARRKARAVKSR